MPSPTAGSPTPLTIRLPDGRTLGLTRYGSPAHRAVVFHHGFGSSGLELPPDAALLARLQLQILAPDRPGVGQSSVYRPLTFPSFADDVVAMLEALEIAGPVGVLGWSVGGVHALALAARHPARVAAVQLLSTCLPLGERATYRHLSPLWKLLRWGQLGFPWLNRTTFLWLSGQWRRHPDRTIDWFIRLMRPAEARVTARFRALLRDAAVQGFAHQGRGVYDDAQAWCRPPGFRYRRRARARAPLARPGRRRVGPRQHSLAGPAPGQCRHAPAARPGPHAVPGKLGGYSGGNGGHDARSG